MKKLKLRATLDFDLNLQDKESFDRTSLTDFKEKLAEFCHEWKGCFYAYCDDENGGYDTDLVPVNVKAKIEKRL